MKIFPLFLILFFSPSHQIDWILRNPVDSTFRIGSKPGPIYKSVGASLYPFWSGTLADYTRRLIMQGKANGLTSFRAILIFEQLNRNPNIELLFSNTIWQPIDALLDAARNQDVHITLELSGLANWMSSLFPAMEPYNPSNYPLWDRLVDFVTSRRNSRNGILYKDDPTIFAYSVLGEIIPYPTSIRSNITATLRRVSARLKQKDPKHLIGSGGLLHMSKYSGYFDPSPYWQSLYNSINVDFCMIHVYQQPNRVLPSTPGGSFQISEWDQLATYAKYCASFGKPFIVDEFGLQMDGYHRNTVIQYFQHAFDEMFDAKIPVVQIWNWNPGSTFDFFPNEDLLLMQVVRANARRWGFQDTYGTIKSYGTDAELAGISGVSTVLTGFETASEISAVSSLYPLVQDTSKSSSGSSSLAMDWIFTDTSFAVRSLTVSPSGWSTDWSAFAKTDGRLVCDTYIEGSFPASPTGYHVRMEFTGKSGRTYVQSGKAYWTNWLLLYQWNRVYMRLDPDVVKEELTSSTGITNTFWATELSQVQRFTVALLHGAFTPASSGKFYLDNCRLEVISAGLMEQSFDETRTFDGTCPNQVVFGLPLEANVALVSAVTSRATSKPTPMITTSAAKQSPITQPQEIPFDNDGYFDVSKLPASFLKSYQVFMFYFGASLVLTSIVLLVSALIFKKYKHQRQKHSTDI